MDQEHIDKIKQIISEKQVVVLHWENKETERHMSWEILPYHEEYELDKIIERKNTPWDCVDDTMQFSVRSMNYDDHEHHPKNDMGPRQKIQHILSKNKSVIIELLHVNRKEIDPALFDLTGVNEKDVDSVMDY